MAFGFGEAGQGLLALEVATREVTKQVVKLLDHSLARGVVGQGRLRLDGLLEFLYLLALGVDLSLHYLVLLRQAQARDRCELGNEDSNKSHRHGQELARLPPHGQVAPRRNRRRCGERIV